MWRSNVSDASKRKSRRESVNVLRSRCVCLREWKRKLCVRKSEFKNKFVCGCVYKSRCEKLSRSGRENRLGSGKRLRES